MALRSLRPAMLVAGLAIVLPLRGQDDPRPAERKKESALPEGAKVRLGVGAPFRFMPSVALLPPDYKTLLVPDRDEGLHRIDLAAGRGTDRTPVLTGGQLVVSADGKRFIIHRTGKFTVRDVETGKSIAEIEPPRGVSTVIISNAPTVSLSGDGTRLAQAGQSSMSGMGHAVVHDVEKNEIIFQAPMQYAGPVVVVMSLDGKLLATRRIPAGLRPGT